ncbi:MAG: hypothetical protein II902_11140 [Selenomonadaceae bacterium]|nr:hypothetical protein [Selenomonadaceae bacterium]
MKLYPDSKVYIFCPGNVHTGGPESLHQLASQLISFGVQAYMVYGQLGDNPFNPQDPVHDAYKKYHVPYLTRLEDTEKNVKILPETVTMELYTGKNLRRVVWWMSVNNYLKNIIKIFERFLKTPFVTPMPKFFTFFNEDENIEHWFKSEYARQFLEFNGMPADKLHHVESYMSQAFLSPTAQIDLSAKKNIVAFNPKKGFEITQNFIKLMPDVEWRAINGMTPEQVQELLASAKVYVDFGEHPGKDRLPREAILSGCVVITGRRGAAANDIDYNIPAEFKFDERTAKPQQVIDKIHSVFENFSEAHAAQKSFRERELNARKNFAAQVADAFEINWSPLPGVAFPQTVSGKIFLLAKKFSASKKFSAGFIVDDVVARANISDKLFWREQNRSFLRLGIGFAEIITRDDAKFLYQEGRIKKFALTDPTDAELDALKNFYGANDDDIILTEP